MGEFIRRSTYQLSSYKMDFKILLICSFLIFPDLFCQASNIQEIEVVTADCENCGMTFLGELSVKVCGQGPAPSICCVVANIDNDDDNFEEGAIDVFSGNDLKECYNFDLGNVVSPDQFSKFFFSNIVILSKIGQCLNLYVLI